MIRAEAQTDLIRVNDGAQGPQGPQGEAGATGPQGPQGETGAAGESISTITNYYLATAASSGVTRETSGWTTTIQTMDSTKQYLWNYEVVVGTKGTTLTTTNPIIIGRYGLNGGTGKGISSITEYYLASSAASGVTTETSGWTTTVQTTDATNKYLWNYEVISYTTGNPYTSSPRIIGTYGDKGEQGPQGIQGVQGVQGPKGDTPEITASKSGTTTTISVDGTSVATINDGAKGDKGDKGDAGEQGPQGIQGIQGVQGPQGEAGNDASISVSKSGNTATITAVSGDGTTTTTTVNDGTNGTNGKSAYQSAVDGGYTGTETNFNTDLAEVSEKAPLTIIREYSNGVLVGKVGQTVGALVNANGTFDVVGVSWSGNTPTVASLPTASFGNTSYIGKSNSSHIQLDNKTLSFYDTNQYPYFVIKDITDDYGQATITETINVFRMSNITPTGLTGNWSSITTQPHTATTYAIDEIISITDEDGNEINLSGVSYRNSQYHYTRMLIGNFSKAVVPDDPPIFEPLLLSASSTSSDTLAQDYFNISKLPDGTIIVDGDTTINVVEDNGSYVVLRKVNELNPGGWITFSSSIVNTYFKKPTGNVQIAYTPFTITYKTSDNNLQSFTFGSRDLSALEGKGSASFGMFNKCSGEGSNCAGAFLDASGYFSNATGYSTVASGKYSHSEGCKTTASGSGSHSQGINTVASGYASHAEGELCGSSGHTAHSEGTLCQARNYCSHAQNEGAIANADGQTALGTFNVIDTSSTSTHPNNDKDYRYYRKYAVIVGNGGSDSNRSNAAVIDWKGNYMGQGMAGMVQMFAGATPPTSWLLCNGQTVSRTDYSELFAAIGTTWGAGDGSTTFKLPDLRGHSPVSGINFIIATGKTA